LEQPLLSEYIYLRCVKPHPIKEKRVMNRKHLLGMFVVVLAFTLAVIGCKDDAAAGDSGVPAWALGDWYATPAPADTPNTNRIKVAEITQDAFILSSDGTKLDYIGMEGDVVNFGIAGASFQVRRQDSDIEWGTAGIWTPLYR
jgi:hypothetical protein